MKAIKNTVIVIKPAAQITADVKPLCAALDEVQGAVIRCESVYESVAPKVVSHIPSGLGAHKAACVEFNRCMDSAAKLVFPHTKAKNERTVRDYLVRVLRFTGYAAPTMPLTTEEKERKEANKRKELSRARAAVKKLEPATKFTAETLTAAAKEYLKETKAAANDTSKEIQLLAAWCESAAKLSLKLPSIATGDVSQLQLRIAAVIAEVKAIMPKAE